MNTILEKYNERVEKVNSLLCVGLDSEAAKLPERFKSVKDSQYIFNEWIIQETNKYVSSYKLNMAFYEARGEQGTHELKMTVDYLRDKHPDIPIICDAKRADIGNTNTGYIRGIFDFYGFDAVTLHPYLGKEALTPFLDRDDKLNIILCRTSNPGAGEFQDLEVNGAPLWMHVAKNVSESWNEKKNCMLVVGATYPEEMKVVREIVGDMPLLIPGIGAQGGDVEATVAAGKTADGKGMMISASRSIIFAESPSTEARTLQESINQYR